VPKARHLAGIHYLDARTIDHDDRGQPRYARGLAPGGQVNQAVGADQEEELVVGPIPMHRFQRLDTVMRSGASSLEIGHLERRVPGRCNPGHLQAV